MSKKSWPSKKDPCYDCGSTIPGHHTKLCDFVEKGDVLDLPAVPGTQWWTESRNVKSAKLGR